MVWLRPLAWGQRSPGGGHQDYPDRHVAAGNTDVPQVFAFTVGWVWFVVGDEGDQPTLLVFHPFLCKTNFTPGANIWVLFIKHTKFNRRINKEMNTLSQLLYTLSYLQTQHPQALAPHPTRVLQHIMCITTWKLAWLAKYFKTWAIWNEPVHRRIPLNKTRENKSKHLRNRAALHQSIVSKLYPPVCLRRWSPSS